MCCFWITYEDIHSREIPLLPLLLFATSGLGYQYINADGGWYFQTLSNMASLLFLLATVWGLYWMKYRTNVLDTGLGWGDVLMFLGLGCWYPSMEFILFFSVNMCLWATLFSFLLLAGKIHKKYPIPLAGLLTMGFLIYEWCKLIYEWCKLSLTYI
ncbi:MAG: prepilin peptidase [Bacteroidota bacterium]